MPTQARVWHPAIENLTAAGFTLFIGYAAYRLHKKRSAPTRVSQNFKVEPVELLGGRKGRDFVLYGDDGLERFTARLLDGEKTLSIGWTDNVPRTAARLREAQQLAGGPGSFIRITGLASDQL